MQAPAAPPSLPPAAQYLIFGDCTSMPPEHIAQCDVMITDPPYSEHTHKSAVSVTGSGGKLYGARKREFGFAHLDDPLRDWVCRAAGLVKRWSVIYSDIESTHALRVGATNAGATYIRTLAWIRWSMPQLSADRPPSGREDLVIFHQARHIAAPELFAGGNTDPVADLLLRGEGKHRAEKPLDQALDLVDWFSDPGETVFDPFAGSGTIGLACAMLGRNYVGFENDPKWAEFAKARISRPHALSERDTERLSRWRASRGI